MQQLVDACCAPQTRHKGQGKRFGAHLDSKHCPRVHKGVVALQHSLVSKSDVTARQRSNISHTSRVSKLVAAICMLALRQMHLSPWLCACSGQEQVCPSMAQQCWLAACVLRGSTAFPRLFEASSRRAAAMPGTTMQPGGKQRELTVLKSPRTEEAALTAAPAIPVHCQASHSCMMLPPKRQHAGGP